MLKLGLVLSAAHLLLVLLCFALFGIGLEGNRSGPASFWGLLQPLLLVARVLRLPAPVLFGLVPVNSVLWGFGGALILTAVRDRSSRG